MDERTFIGALGKKDTSGLELITKTCSRHGRYQFHPAITGSRHTVCPRCQVEHARES